MEKSRKNFVEEALVKQMSFSRLCRNYGITRNTGYKWLNRYLAGEPLTNKSKRPFHIANKIDEKQESLILSIREQYPYWGSRKLRKILENEGKKNLPSVTTFTNVLKRNNKITKEASEKSTPYKRFEKGTCNEMWQMDFKGQRKLQNSDEYCFPLTIKDDKSRKCIDVVACQNQLFLTVKEVLIKAFKTYGMPDSILSDNGKPWGDSKAHIITAMDVWLMEHGIRPIHISPKHPQSQGKIESLNKALTEELLKHRNFETFEEAQNAFDNWKIRYNTIRPNEAIDLEVPDKIYTKSSKIYKEKVEPFKYASECEIVKVDHVGYVKIKGKKPYFIGKALSGKYVALVNNTQNDNGNILIQFREFIIAIYDKNSNMFKKTSPRVKN